MIGWISECISDIFNIKRKNARRDIQNIWIYSKVRYTCVGIYKWTLHSSKFRQCLNQWKSTHGICYHESFAESKFDAKYVNTVKSGTVFKSNQMFETKHLEQIDCKRPSNIKQMNRVQIC